MSKPDYAIHAAHDADITDNWQEASDPAAEFGETCRAWFDVETVEGWSGDPRDEFDVAKCILVAICINDGHGANWRNREQAIQLLGDDVVTRIEDHETEYLNEMGWAA